MEKQRIGFIGLGNMGLGMASCLVKSGYKVVAYNRTGVKGAKLEALGASIAATPSEAVADADAVVLSLKDSHAVEAVLSGPDGVFSSLRVGGYLINTSTVSPAFARELAEKAAKAGYRALDACILGNPAHAFQGELRVMVGGNQTDFSAVEPILQTIGKEVSYLGASGLGATMKLVLNMLMGVQMQSLAEAVVFGEVSGLPREKILSLIARSGYSSPVMSFRCELMQRRAFQNVSFKLALMQKDMALVSATSQDLHVPLPVTECASAMLAEAMQEGLGDLDVAATLALMERRAGLEGYSWPTEDNDQRHADRSGQTFQEVRS
jgi:3-hydroxyisobutyrate dehydrogenase